MTARCPYCDNPMRGKRHAPTRDHINPKTRGGGPCVTVCAWCNVFKANRTVLHWLMLLEMHRPARVQAVCRLFAHHQITTHVSPDERPALTAFMARYV